MEGSTLMGSKQRSRRRSSLGGRLARRWLTMMAVGAAVGGAMVLSDEEKRQQLLARAKEVGEQVRQMLGEQWQSASPRVQEWREQGRRLLESGTDTEQPEL